VNGLDSRAVMYPAVAPKAQSVDPKPSCSGSVSGTGGYAPADLADPGAYDYQSLLDGGYDGTGESIAFVEFSDYKDSDITSFMGCFSLSTPVDRVEVGGGSPETSGNVEVVLDVQTALAAAPDLDHAYVYVAPNDGTTSMADVINAIVADKAGIVTAVSISWGSCEELLGPAEVSDANTALQLAAVAGMFAYVASGDFDSAGCGPGNADDVVVDPASQPYATGVGGTSLDTSGGRVETVWTSGGGGLSMFWPMPSYQSDAGVSAPESSGEPCGLLSGLCRHMPDVSMEADPLPGYVIYCTAPAAQCGGWTRVGGTSAGAPLLAGMTADANEYSLANGGDRLGFANPFLYESFSGGSTFFNDVVNGSNGTYVAVSGVRPRKRARLDRRRRARDGPGRLHRGGGRFSRHDLADRVAHGREDDHVRANRQVQRELTDTTASAPLEGELVYLEVLDEDGYRLWRTQAPTDANGHWSISLSRPLRKKLRWQAYFLGGETTEGSRSAHHVIRVKPILKATSSSRRVDGRYVINLGGEVLAAQWRPTGSSSWQSGGTARVAPTGKATLKAQWTGPGRYDVRWRYAGSTGGNWLTATSPVKRFVVS